MIGFVRVRETGTGPRFYARNIAGGPLRPDLLAPDNEPLFDTPEDAASALHESFSERVGAEVTWHRPEVP